MILGLGTDICPAARWAGMLERHGVRAVERVLCEAEAALIEVLSNGPMTKAEAGLASGLSYWKVQKALTNLLAANRIRQREDKKWELSSSLLV